MIANANLMQLLLGLHDRHRLAGAAQRYVVPGLYGLLLGDDQRRMSLEQLAALDSDADGVLAVYRKVHLWDRERLVFIPGDEAPPVVDTIAGRVGMVICYDLEFPEMVRGLLLRGAEIVAVPTNCPS